MWTKWLISLAMGVELLPRLEVREAILPIMVLSPVRITMPRQVPRKRKPVLGFVRLGNRKTANWVRLYVQFDKLKYYCWIGNYTCYGHSDSTFRLRINPQMQLTCRARWLYTDSIDLLSQALLLTKCVRVPNRTNFPTNTWKHQNNAFEKIKSSLLPSTALVEKKARFLVSSGLSWVFSGVRDWGSDSPVREELST